MNTSDRIRKTPYHRMAWIAALVITGASGYCLRRAQEDPSVVLTTRRNPRNPPNEVSFSEVRNASATLQNLCQEVVANLQTRHQAGTSRTPLSDCKTIRDIEVYHEEFRGTAQELVMVQSLLSLLKEQSLYNRWLDTYLRALYERPTDSLVGRLAREAVGASLATGRQNDLFSGFTHVLTIPFEFQGKSQVEAAMRQLAPSCSSKPLNP